MLWAEGDREGKVGLVLGHGCEGDVGGIGEVWFGAAVDVSEKLGDFTYPIGAVVEEEEGVVVYENGQDLAFN